MQQLEKRNADEYGSDVLMFTLLVNWINETTVHSCHGLIIFPDKKKEKEKTTRKERYAGSWQPAISFCHHVNRVEVSLDEEFNVMQLPKLKEER